MPGLHRGGNPMPRQQPESTNIGLREAFIPPESPYLGQAVVGEPI